MTNIIDKLINAQKYAMSIRPAIGGFPVLAEVLRQAGIKSNHWHLPSCQSVYIMEEGNVVQQGTPLINGTHQILPFDKNALIAAFRKDQQGQTTFPEFLEAAWSAGVVSYDVDFLARKVIYHGINGESYCEEYPKVEVQD